MHTRFWLLFTALAQIGFSGSVQAQAEGLPYTQGSVWTLTMVRTTAGFDDDYLRSLATTWRKVADEAKKQGLVQSYKILSANASGPEDWNLLLMIEFKNWAAFDGTAKKFEAIQQKVIGGQDTQRQLATKRMEIRRIIGTKDAQEIFLK